MGGDIPSPAVNPIHYLRSSDYRMTTHSRWRGRGRWAPLVAALGLVLFFLGLTVFVVISAAVYWAIYHLIRHGSLPAWVLGVLSGVL